MASDKMELREILESNIGQVYKSALEALNDQAAAKDVTRRVMALLKRTYDAGLSVTPETVKRLTEDCCAEQASYSSKRASFRDGVIADMPDFDTALASIEEAAKPAPSKATGSLKTAGVAKRGFFAKNGREYDDDDDEYDDEYDEDDELDDDEYDEYDDDDDDDDDDDEEYEPLFEKKPRQPLLPLIGLWALVILLGAAAFCLAVMLMKRNVLPGGSSRFVEGFTAWFNSSLFPLF